MNDLAYDIDNGKFKRDFDYQLTAYSDYIKDLQKNIFLLDQIENSSSYSN